MVNKGSEQLKKFIDKCGGRLDAASKLNISYATICAWLYGHRKPDRYHREVLAKKAQISATAWDT